MALRTIQAPGIQVNEIDRSQYNVAADKSLPNSPTCFIAGFADKGDDYTIYSIPSKEAFEEKYGYPQTEAERYFYNGSLEILNKGAKLITAKLPYCNNAKDKYSYVDYSVFPTELSIITNQQILGKWNTINDIRDVLTLILQHDTIEEILGKGITTNDIQTLPQMRDVVLRIIESPKFEQLYMELQNADTIKKEEAIKNTFNEQILTKLTCNNVDTLKAHGITIQIKNNNNEFEDIDNNFLTTTNTQFNELIKDLSANNVEKYTFPYTFPEIKNIIDNISKGEYTNSSGEPQDIIELKVLYTAIINSNLTLQAAKEDIGENYNIEYSNEYAGYIFIEADIEYINTFIPIQLVTDLRSSIQKIVNALNDQHPYIDLKLNDSNIETYCHIIPDIDIKTGMARSGLITTEQLDDYLTNNYTEIKNKIRIVDITRQQYNQANFNSVKSTITGEDGKDYAIYTNDCLGIVPVIVTATNALYFQNMIQEAQNKDYNCIAGFNSTMSKNPKIDVQLTKNNVLDNTYIEFKNSPGDPPTKETLSKMVADCFPQIEYANHLHYDQEHFKKIGIVVLSSFIDTANNNKLNFSILESFVGTLDRDSKSYVNNSSLFIDNVVNNNSNYIRCFSCANSDAIKKANIIAIKNQTATSLGLYKLDCEKNIQTQESILTPIKRILDHMRDPRSYQIDLIVDSGLTNIGQYLQGIKSEYSSLLTIAERPKYWWSIATIFDNFCKFTRRDCMYLLDCPRPFCLEGNEKIVRRTKPTNNITYNIIPKLKHLTGINSSYTAGYCNWFKCKDLYTNNAFWCPPSIKAAGVYCYTDIYYHTWNAPAGISRGKINDAIDVAFSPTNEEAGRLYTQCWNYAINYPTDGIILEGQKTFQRKATALDRVNVRRLMLHLEKETVNIAKYFLYEGHTAYLRSRFVNLLQPIFEKALNGYGISDYIIKCDEENNPPIAIERNELHCSIAVKPVKAVEFIVLNFIVTNQTANVSEEVVKE